MIKKVLTLSLAFIGLFTLAACTQDQGLTTEEILNLISEAMEEVDLPSETSTDLTLPNTGLHDVVITWESSDTDYITDAGVVTRPAKTEGNETVTMTATLELEDQVLTKSFDVTVLAVEDLNDQEKVDADAATLYIEQGATYADVTLPSTGANGTTITWSSNNTDYITDAGVVTRPAVGAGDEAVTLTATITLNDASTTKEFDLLVKEGFPLLTIDSIKSSSTKGDNVMVQALVMGLFTAGTYKGYFLYDGTGFIYVHVGASMPDVVVGEVYSVAGAYDIYFGMPQISMPSEEFQIDMDIAMPAADVVTVKDIVDMGTDPDPDFFSSYINITGTVTFDGTYYYLEDDLGNAVELNDDSDITLLIAELGKSVTMNGFYHTYHGGHGNHQISFTGNAADLTVNQLSEADALAADVASIDIPGVAAFDITLPTSGTNGTTFTNWTSGDTAVFANDGTFVDFGATEVTVTFSATATNGSTTETITVDVVVPMDYTIAEVLDLPQGDNVSVTATVSVIFEGSGYFLWDGTGFVYVYTNTYLDQIAAGDELTIAGYVSGFYHGALQLKTNGYVNNSSDNTLAPVVTAELSDVINAEYPEGTFVTVIGKLVEVQDGSYTDLMIEDALGNQVQIHYNSNIDQLDTFVGKVVEIELIIYTWDYMWFNGLAADVTEVTAGFSDADTGNAIAAQVIADLGNVNGVLDDLTFPATFADPAATLTWLSSDATVVANDGTITIQYGTEGTATVTLTVSYNGTDYTKDVVITVIDGNDLTPTDIATAKAEADGTMVVVTGVVSGLDADGGIFFQDADGTALFIYNPGFTVDIGDMIVVSGELATYTSYTNNLRQLNDATLIETTSTGNTVTVLTDVTPAELGVVANIADYQSKRYTMTFTIEDLYDYGNVLFAGEIDVDGTTVLTYIAMDRDYLPYVDALYSVGDTITLTFNVARIDFGDVIIRSVEVPALSDAEKLLAAEELLEIDDVVETDMTLPSEMTEYDATITWSSSDTNFITDAGVVTQPAAGQSDATVTMTATITVGSETPITKEFTVTVKAEIVIPAPTAAFTETFDNFPETSSSYNDGSFVGVESVTWTYVSSRGDSSADAITGEGLMFAKSGAGSLSATIGGGISSISIDFLKPFSTASEIEVYINGTLVGTSVTSTDTAQTFTIDSLTITGEYTIEIVNTNGQTVIDNVVITPNSGS